nr:aromatic amino acid lyase [Myxococcus sp. AM010]
MIGALDALFEGERLPSKQALEKTGLKQVVLEVKKYLTLFNGAQAMFAVGTLTQL